jgi:hypothetical protein
VIGRATPRVAVRELAALAVELELEHLLVAFVEPAVEVEVVLPTREADFERERRIGGGDLEIQVDDFELVEKFLPRGSTSLLIEELEALALIDHLAELDDERLDGLIVFRDRVDRRGRRVFPIALHDGECRTLRLGKTRCA